MVSDPGFRTLSTSCILQDRNSLSTGSWCWSLVPAQEQSKEVERVVTASDGGWGGGGGLDLWGWEGRLDARSFVRMDGWTEIPPSVLQDIVPFGSAALPKF